jgi:uncharacterized protein YlxW (UPF0749 family)
MVVSIDKVISDFIQQEVQSVVVSMDLENMITSEVRDTWDMDELDRVDETVDRVDTLELWVHDAEDKLGIQNVIDLENSVKNLIEHVNELQDRVNITQLKLQSLQLERKSFLSRLFFWR